MHRRSRNANNLHFPVIHPPTVVLLVQLRFVNNSSESIYSLSICLSNFDFDTN